MTKRLVRNIAFSLVLISVLVFSGCSGVSDVSISERLNRFIADANAGNYSTMFENLHPDSGSYNQAKDPAFWENYFPSGQVYSLSNIAISGESATANINSSGPDYSGESLTFQFKNDPESGGLFGGDSDNWKILSISGVVSVP